LGPDNAERCALLVLALERCSPRHDTQLSRVAVDLLGPVPVTDQLWVRASVERPGTKIEPAIRNQVGILSDLQLCLLCAAQREDRRMQKALAPQFSTWPDENPYLIGSVRGATAFPAQPRCPKYSGCTMSEILLPRRRTLVAWTTQGFPPGAPYMGPTGNAFVPFGVGLVRLGLHLRRCHPRRGAVTEKGPCQAAVLHGGRVDHGSAHHR
jgi:uncharacterized OB-fold protein